MIGFLVFGLFVGFVARWIVPGRQKLGVGVTLVIGALGSIVGGTIANILGTGDVWELNIIGSLAAIGTAVVLVTAAEKTGLGRRRDHSG